MLKKFATWFIFWALSFLVSNVFGWTEQGKAFFYIHMGAIIILFLALIVIAIFLALIIHQPPLAVGASLLILLVGTAVVTVILFITWGASKLFDVNFYVVYQIMTFGQCLCLNSNTTAQSEEI